MPLLATTHDGCLCPLPHLVHPLPAGGVLETPQHAARYVSLLQSRRSASPAATAAPPGHPSGLVFNGCCLPHVVLAAGSATPAERPLLLCSLLLGFGMDAWVCVGTAAAVGGAQQSVLGGLWVVTRRHGACSASLWDPCTGRRYDTPEGCCLHESAAVTCLFNHNAIYSSTTPGGAVLTGLLRDGGLDLNNHAAWHGLHVTPAMLPPPQPTCTPPPPSAAAGHMQLERQVEWVVKELLSQRLTGAANGPRAVAWDDSLAQKLALVLVGHEEEALTGAAALCLEDFNHVIQRCVPKGYVFRGLPLHFNHLCPTRLARRLLEDTQAYGILAGHRAVSAVALKLRVKEYGKHVRSVWIMLGSIALG